MCQGSGARAICVGVGGVPTRLTQYLTSMTSREAWCFERFDTGNFIHTFFLGSLVAKLLPEILFEHNFVHSSVFNSPVSTPCVCIQGGDCDSLDEE